MNEAQNVTAGVGLEPDTPIVLHEAHETIEAIRNGEVDAFVMKEGDEHQVFVVHGAYHPYRLFVEQMNEGAAVLGHRTLVAGPAGKVVVCARVHPRTGKLFEIENVDRVRRRHEGWRL